MTRPFILLAWMSVVFAVRSVAATEPQGESPSPSQTSSRSLNALQSDVHAALRAEAVSRRQGPNTAEVVRLVELFRELAAHPKRDDSQIIRGLGLQLRSRLKEVSEQIERQAKQRKTAPASVIPQTQVLAQQIAPPPGPAQAGQAAANQPAAGQVAQPGQIVDFGPQLVELIQATISPDSWNINGGLSSIVYYQPLRVLVISAPQSVHGEIGGAIGQLRR